MRVAIRQVCGVDFSVLVDWYRRSRAELDRSVGGVEVSELDRPRLGNRRSLWENVFGCGKAG